MKFPFKLIGTDEYITQETKDFIYEVFREYREEKLGTHDKPGNPDAEVREVTVDVYVNGIPQKKTGNPAKWASITPAYDELVTAAETALKNGSSPVIAYHTARINRKTNG